MKVLGTMLVGVIGLFVVALGIALLAPFIFLYGCGIYMLKLLSGSKE